MRLPVGSVPRVGHSVYSQNCADMPADPVQLYEDENASYSHGPAS